MADKKETIYTKVCDACGEEGTELNPVNRFSVVGNIVHFSIETHHECIEKWVSGLKFSCDTLKQMHSTVETIR